MNLDAHMTLAVIWNVDEIMHSYEGQIMQVKRLYLFEWLVPQYLGCQQKKDSMTLTKHLILNLNKIENFSGKHFECHCLNGT